MRYISVVRINPEIMMQCFSHGCSMRHYNGTSCTEGVLLDLREKNHIRAHADLIKRCLESQQEYDFVKWFDHNIEYGIDFPSGRCDGTAVRERVYVFLDSKSLCALQKTALAEGMDEFALKPFYCVAFPLVIDGHVLTKNDPKFTNRSQCCSIVPDGSLTVLDICREEFECILGTEELEEIEKVFKDEVGSPLVSAV